MEPAALSPLDLIRLSLSPIPCIANDARCSNWENSEFWNCAKFQYFSVELSPKARESQGVLSPLHLIRHSLSPIPNAADGDMLQDQTLGIWPTARCSPCAIMQSINKQELKQTSENSNECTNSCRCQIENNPCFSSSLVLVDQLLKWLICSFCLTNIWLYQALLLLIAGSLWINQIALKPPIWIFSLSSWANISQYARTLKLYHQCHGCLRTGLPIFLLP